MAYIYELVVTEGPLVGRTFRIPTHTTLRIGRTSRDVPLFQDERASMDHAEVTWTSQGFWICDLGSEGGTFIDGYPIEKKGQPLLLGSYLRVGQTVLRLDERRTIPPWLGWSAAFGAPVVLALVGAVVLAVGGVNYEPELRFASPVPMGASSQQVSAVPTWFMRRYGTDHHNLTSSRITDFDEDGRSEVWLRLPDRELVVELDVDQGWTVLGDLPLGCSDRQGVDFPEQECAGIRYRMVAGSYVPVKLASPVAWIAPLMPYPTRERGQPEPSGPRVVGQPKPFRVSLAHPGRLVDFLSERGISEPIHYLICEGALPGVRPQVLTQRGVLQDLDMGCLGAINAVGPGLSDDLSQDDPVAVAFTANGYTALIADARTYELGDASGVFGHAMQSERLAAFVVPPESRAVRLEVEGTDTRRDPIAQEALVLGVRHLSHAEDAPAAPPMMVASIDSAGVASFDLPGCSVVEVRTSSWHCLLRRWCAPGATFLTATEVGCGEPRRLLTAPFKGGTFVARSSQFEMWTSIDVFADRGQIDVNRVRVGFRDIASPADIPADADTLRP